MPKVKPSELEQKRCDVRACITGKMMKHAVSNEQAAKRARFTERTFRNRMHRPEKFTLEELWALGVILKFDDQDKMEML